MAATSTTATQAATIKQLVDELRQAGSKLEAAVKNLFPQRSIVLIQSQSSRPLVGVMWNVFRDEVSVILEHGDFRFFCPSKISKFEGAPPSWTEEYTDNKATNP